MASRRTERVGRLLQEEIAAIFQKEGRNWFGSVLVTVSAVEPTPDFGLARVYLSVFGTEHKEKIVTEAELRHSRIRKLLGQAIRHELRQVPELQFFLDDTLDQAERMDRLFDDLNIPPPEEDDDPSPDQA